LAVFVRENRRVTRITTRQAMFFGAGRQSLVISR
jgi:hypothetical protein